MSGVPQLYEFLIEPIKQADARTRFLYAYLLGPQVVFETLHDKIKDLPLLNDPRDCPDEFLIYLKDIVGFDSALDYITSGLSAADLRRLIQSASILWKERGTEAGLVDFFRALTGKPSLVFTWFDMVYLLDEGYFDSDEPWLIGDPGDSSFSEYQNYLFVMDEGDLDRSLARNTVDLARPFSERIRLVYLDFMDDFTFGLNFWTDEGDAPAEIIDDQLYLPLVGNQKYRVNSLRSAEWKNYQADLNLKTVEGNLFYIRLYYNETADTYYQFQVDYNLQRILVRRRWASSTQTLATFLFPYPVLFNVYYRFTLNLLVQGDDSLLLQCLIDGNLIGEHIDTDGEGSRPSQGTVWIRSTINHEGYINLVTLFEIPVDGDDVEP